ncbi:MAG TPA: amino acid permease, partial [Gammaproteobacteria bacterium]|nr:amino acid permease [Gammaproteobacteria bacterium]
MSSSNKKIGFWSVTSLVAGSQIGSGIFLLPASLAIYGGLSLASWLITATGAIFLALIFAKLCAKIPKTGGPHAYVQAAFGQNASFFTAWTYWVISWMSSTAVVIAVIGYLHPLMGDVAPTTKIALEIGVLIAITGLNILGVKAAGYAEFIFTVLKVVPLALVPLWGLQYVHLDHFIPFNPTHHTIFNGLNAAALLTLWGFIGVECATTPAGSVDNPSKTIPKAIISGTLLVAFLYMLSSFVVMGVVPLNELAHSKAPFADAAHYIFGGQSHWHYSIAMMGSIVCLGTLNAWILTSGQIAMGAAQDGLFPKFFKKTNANNAPAWSIMLSSCGMVPLLFFTLSDNLVEQLNSIIDLSVTAFLLVYTACIL